MLESGTTEVTVTATAAETLNPAALLAIDGLLLRYDYHQFYQLGEAYGWWQGPVVLPPPILHASKAKADSKDGAQDKKLTPREIRRLQERGVDIHDLKDGMKVGGESDLYKDPDGDIYVKPKNSPVRGEPTGYNINDF